MQDALNGQLQGIHRQLLSLYLARLDLIESHIESLDGMILAAMKAHEQAVVRLAELPWTRNRLSAPDHRRNRTAGSSVSISGFSWLLGLGSVPGVKRTPAFSSSDRSAKGNTFHAPAVNQLAHAAVRKEGCPAPDCLPMFIFTSGVRQGSLGDCPPPLSTYLEGLARGCLFMWSTGPNTRSARPQKETAAARDTT